MIPFLVPIIIGGVSLATAAFGASKVHEGVSGIGEAKRKCDRAREGFETALTNLDRAGQASVALLEELARQRLRIRTTTIPEYAEFLRCLNKKVKRKCAQQSSSGVRSVDVDGRLSEFALDSLEAADVLNGLGRAGSAAVAAGQGAASLIATFGVASTGTAISGLSGAAATNAMLAWLGGGSLAAGGGGMALGSIILGGIYVAPAALIGGLTIASQGQKALTQAEEYVQAVACERSKVSGQIDFLFRVRRRVKEVSEVTNDLYVRALAALRKLNPETLDVNSDEDMARLTILDGLMRTLLDCTKVPVLGQDGLLNDDLSEFLSQCRVIATGGTS